ncbi:hypothetical protein LCGC14_2664160 [marine sediment metagenome]|uniref:Uncharacterized protein n=1 Tax=marine sediment metagenome TaxID=412755 RepID=A0A0F9CHZ0_9ZZZZ
MNKKGEFEFIILPIAFAIFALFMGFLVINTHYYSKAIDKACEDIGMEYYYSSSQMFCVDEQDKAHYVKFDCEGWLIPECTARIISVGDVRIVSSETNE